jgi:hypothetical protein
MENENKQWIRWINKTQEYNKSHRSSKMKLVWSLMLRWPLGRPKNRWEDDIINDMKKLNIKNWTSYIQDRKNWKLYAEKGKTFKEWSCST